MINKFSCHNFRNIQAEDLEFEKINILIGPNNSGKSNFIKALTFFSEMLRTGKEDNLKSALPSVEEVEEELASFLDKDNNPQN